MYNLYGIIDNAYIYLGEDPGKYFNFCVSWETDDGLMCRDYPEQAEYVGSGHENTALAYICSFDTEEEAWEYAKSITAVMPPVTWSSVPRRAPRKRPRNQV